MFKVAILGCENSHANHFLNIVLNEKKVDDVEFVGVYSDDVAASKKLNESFGVPIMDNYDSLVGQVDGIIITARHGDNHYKYAKPYIASGIPMFVDNPITCDEQEAVAFMKELKAAGGKVNGGSSLIHAGLIKEFKEVVESQSEGKVYSGYFRSPVSIDSVHGGFYFYAQHLVQVVLQVFGYYPKSVKAYRNDGHVMALLHYDNYNVALDFGIHSYYHACINTDKGIRADSYSVDGCYAAEFMEFHAMLHGEAQPLSYNDFIAPVSVINAIKRSYENGTEEAIVYAEQI